MRVGVVVNPAAAGAARGGSLVDVLAAAVGGDGEVVATHDLAELDRTLERFRDDGVTVLAACGGDGTYYHVLRSAVRVWQGGELPSFVPLPGGTINNLTHSLGVGGTPASVLARVLDGLRGRSKPHRRPLTLLRVNADDYGYIVGAGLIAGFLDLYYEGRRPGPVRAAALLVALFFSNLVDGPLIRRVVPRVPARVVADGVRLPFERYTLLIASSVTHIGLGVRAFYRAGAAGGALHLLAGSSTPGQLLRKLWRFALGWPSGLDNLFDGAPERVTVEFDEPQIFTINGELMDATTRLELERGPTVDCLIG